MSKGGGGGHVLATDNLALLLDDEIVDGGARVILPAALINRAQANGDCGWWARCEHFWSPCTSSAPVIGPVRAAHNGELRIQSEAE